ncbi:MAG: response regulator, partial [Synergistaceae bacterium]|nr:response regulator [Synergistaceae bacterium]
LLYGDDQRIAQVVTNLLVNAVKFTPEGGSIRLEVRLEDEDEGVCTVMVEVIDSGVGMTEEQQSRLFMPFEQADSGISRKYGGTGLGLAISKRIVEMAGGRIWAVSAPGEGSTFGFTVKLGRVSDDGESSLPLGVNIQNLRILLVEDAEEVRDYFKWVVGASGITCDIASDASEARGVIEKSGPYDMYFVDWQMPGINGMDLTRWIKARDGDNAIVVMISSPDCGMDGAEARDAGVNRFLSKPLFPSDIFDCINECLGDSTIKPSGGLPLGEADRFDGSRVLLAEDVEINREIVQALLEPSGIEFEFAINGAEAVRMFGESPGRYDLILMDVQMPEMDGYEATKRIRGLNTEESRRVPIIAITANVFREDVEKCLDAGMDGHIGKPLDFEEVLSTLRKYLVKKNPDIPSHEA